MPTARQYKPSNLIGMASAHMKDYRLPIGLVDIQPEDTGVIVLIALYFIEKDIKVSRTKLEAYILKLDELCFEERGVLLFCWKLNGGRIRNFKNITDFMLKKGLIQIKGRSYFEIGECGRELVRLFPMLVNIKKWLEVILQNYKDKTGQYTLSAVLYATPTRQYMKALTNAGLTIDNRGMD